MLDRTSYTLLKKFYKYQFLSHDDINKYCKTNTNWENDANIFISNLSAYQFVQLNQSYIDNDGEAIYNGYRITLLGMAYVENKRSQFWGFAIPYAITSLIALLSLITQLA